MQLTAEKLPIVQNLQSLDDQALLELLSRKTEEYTKHFSLGGDKELIESLRKEIVSIQIELQARRKIEETDTRSGLDTNTKRES